MTPKKIVIIEPCGKRGIIQYTQNMCNELTNLGHKVLLITSINFETKELQREYSAVEVFDRFWPHPLRLCKAILKLKKINPDIVHLQGAMHPTLYLFLIRLIKIICKTKFIYTAHEIFMHGKKKTKRNGSLKKLLEIVDTIIVHADTAKYDIIESFHIDESKIISLPHGDNSLLTNIGESTVVRDNKKRILFFGIIEQKKGLTYLIRAFAKVLQEISDVKLIIAGQPFEDTKPYLQEIKDLGIEESVETCFRYIPINEVPEYFMAADVVVVPYTHACQSGVIAAAYSFSKPVVTTDCGGLPEMVRHGQSGFVVPVRDVDELAKAIIEVLNNDTLRNNMGQYAKRLSEEIYSWKKVIGEIDKIYNTKSIVAG